MPLDFKEIKDNLTVDKLKSLFNKNKEGEESVQGWEKTTSAEDRAAQTPLQRGLNDIKVVLQEGKALLFVKQLIVLLVVFLLARYGMKSLNANRNEIKDKMAALQIQQVNKDDYIANKDYLLRLEPLFPDVSQKKEWLIVRLNKMFEKRKIRVSMDGNPAEDAQNTYIVGKQPVTFKANFKELGKLMAEIENGEDFLRVSEMTITKLTDKDNLGENSISVNFATVFPQTKYAQTLFKDYAEQMAKIKQQQQAEEPKADTATEQNNA